MSWEIKSIHKVTNGLQNRFQITHEQLDFFSEEFQKGLGEVDCEQASIEFADDLLSAIGDHLSRRNLEDIICVCKYRLENWW